MCVCVHVEVFCDTMMILSPRTGFDSLQSKTEICVCSVGLRYIIKSLWDLSTWYLFVMVVATLLSVLLLLPNCIN